MRVDPILRNSLLLLAAGLGLIALGRAPAPPSSPPLVLWPIRPVVANPCPGVVANHSLSPGDTGRS